MRYIQFIQPNGRSASVARLGGRFGSDGFQNEVSWLVGSARDQFPVDLYEDKENTYVRAELPGVTREGIAVEIIDGSLSIAATRTQKTGAGKEEIKPKKINVSVN